MTTTDRSPITDRALKILNLVRGELGDTDRMVDIADALCQALSILAVMQPAPRASLSDAIRVLEISRDSMPTVLAKDGSQPTRELPEHDRPPASELLKAMMDATPRDIQPALAVLILLHEKIASSGQFAAIEIDCSGRGHGGTTPVTREAVQLYSQRLNEAVRAVSAGVSADTNAFDIEPADFGRISASTKRPQS